MEGLRAVQELLFNIVNGFAHGELSTIGNTVNMRIYGDGRPAKRE